MQEALAFLETHGYLVIFVTVLVDQLGVPLPSLPILLGAGALAGTGRLGAAQVLLISVAAATLADLAWYWLGRRRGMNVLSLLCRISLEPETCVRKTERMFSTRGGWTLLFAKFVPGLSTVAPPLAGIIGMPLWRFVLLDGIGALLWAATYGGLGYAFSYQLEALAESAARVGVSLAVLAGVLVGGYLLVRWAEYQLFVRRLRASRIEPEELMALMASGEDVVVLDVRHRVELEIDPRIVVGAVRVDLERLEEEMESLPDGEALPGVPRDRELVVYCS